jgi:polyphosphate kinase
MAGKSKKSKKAKKAKKADKARRADEGAAYAADPNETSVEGTVDGSKRKMKRSEYEAAMEVLQGELVVMQEWVKATGAKVCVVFEGLDSAGKGGTIRRITERTSPRVFKHIALPAPTDREKSQMYIQRYIAHFPAAGEVAIFDRSWYNRAGVEPVLGFCTPEETERFLEIAPQVEKAMVDSGIILIKYWLNVSVEEQARRLESRIDDPRKIWKLSPTDLRSYGLRYEYCRARDTMLAATDTPWGPWFVAHNDDKKRGRLNIISHLLDHIPYESVPRDKIEFPDPPSPDGYTEPDLRVHLVPEKF